MTISNLFEFLRIYEIGVPTYHTLQSGLGVHLGKFYNHVNHTVLFDNNVHLFCEELELLLQELWQPSMVLDNESPEYNTP